MLVDINCLKNTRKVLQEDSNINAHKLLRISKGKNDPFSNQNGISFVTFAYLNYIPSSCKISEKSLE